MSTTEDQVRDRLTYTVEEAGQRLPVPTPSGA